MASFGMGSQFQTLSQCPFENFGALSIRGLSKKSLSTLRRSPFHLYVCFLMATSFVYYLLGGRLGAASTLDKLGMASTVAETVGLLTLWQKIQLHGTVAGISGQTIAMYSLVYTLRQVMLIPPLSWLAIDGWVIEVLQLPSIVIVLAVLRSVFVTRHRSYSADLDSLKIRFLLPVCLVSALVAAPQFRRGALFSFFQAVYMYLDMLALMPQVVMMARGGGKVEAPIAHFVAATAIREVVDLWFWCLDFDLGPQGYYGSFNYSGWICVITQAFSVLLVADFMYYYFKARLSGSALSEDLALPADMDV